MNILFINIVETCRDASPEPARRGSPEVGELPKAERFTDLAQEYEAQGCEVNC